MNYRWQGRNAWLRIIVFALGVLAAGGLAHAVGYKEFAESLVRQLPPDARFRPDLEEILAGYANTYRLEQHKEPLTANDLFLVAARAHAADMMLNGFLGHVASTGHNFDSRIRTFVGDITKFPAMAENAARESQNTPVDQAKTRRILQQWIDSPPHRKSLVSRDHAFVATAVVQRGNKLWAVQIFWARPRQKGIFQ